MRIIAESNLREFWESHADVQQQLQAWAADTRSVNWQAPADIKARYGNASILGNSRVCFNIKGNDYRLIVAVSYTAGIVLLKWVGAHAEYDKIDAETVEMWK